MSQMSQMSQYKLLLSDLDGTLLTSDGRISPGNAQAIQAARAQGLKFALNSGRSYMSLRLFEEALGLCHPGEYGIGFNGGVVYEADTRRIIRECRLPRAEGLAVIQNLRRFSANILVYAGEHCYIEDSHPTFDEYSRKSGLPNIRLRQFEEITEDFSKILARGDLPGLRGIYAQMETLSDSGHIMFFSAHNLLEFSSPDACKEAGLRFLARHLGIPMEQTIAVGDNFNDTGMIRAAGLGVATRNAEDEVKATANYITKADNNHDALQEIIETFILT